MSERIPPHNEEAEKSVLGAVMLSKDALFNVMEEVKAGDFYYQAHREIFEAVRELYQKSSPVDTLTVSEELKKRKALDMVGGRAYVASLSAGVPSTSNAGEYAKIVAEKSILRSLIETAGGIIEKGYQEKMEANTILDFSEQAIFSISQKKQKKAISHIREVLMENITAIDKAANAAGGLTGVGTGFKDLDRETSGFQKSDLVILAARPAMGKTAFALNVAMQSAMKYGSKVLIFSMEMSREQLGQRLLAMESRIDMQKLKTGKMEQRDWESLSHAAERLSKAHIYIDDTPGLQVMEMKSKCRRMKTEKGLDMVIIDYLQLMSVEGRVESRQQEITTLSRYLKQLAREIDCPVLVLSQLSRAPETRTSDHRPILSDLRESGSNEQDADIVLFLYRDEYYKKEESLEPGVCEVIIAKHRSGPTSTIKLTWLARCTRFADMSKKDLPSGM